MTEASALEALTDAELAGRYEALRPLPRTAATDAYRREIERRARVKGAVDCPGAGVAYVWDDASESVVRRLIAPAILKARSEEVERLRRLGQSLGRAALDGPILAAGSGRIAERSVKRPLM
jgi:hypothetical protein